MVPEPGLIRYLKPGDDDAATAAKRLDSGQVSPPGPTRRPRRHERSRPVGLIERRVGLLFALFVLLFALAIGRAAWIQAVQGASLSADARLQQTQTLTIPGQRGAILDRRGNELAVSEDAADVIATPYQVDDPARAAQRLAGVLHVPEQPILESLANDSSGFAYVDRQVDLPTAEKVRRLHLPGSPRCPTAAGSTRRASWPRR